MNATVTYPNAHDDGQRMQRQEITKVVERRYNEITIYQYTTTCGEKFAVVSIGPNTADVETRRVFDHI